eukprot:scaffold6855_cov126-Isochrysis_galbana.AAC.7
MTDHAGALAPVRNTVPQRCAQGLGCSASTDLTPQSLRDIVWSTAVRRVLTSPPLRCAGDRRFGSRVWGRDAWPVPGRAAVPAIAPPGNTMCDRLCGDDGGGRRAGAVLPAGDTRSGALLPGELPPSSTPHP